MRFYICCNIALSYQKIRNKICAIYRKFIISKNSRLKKRKKVWNTEVEGFLESIAYVLGDLESFKAV